MIKISLHYRCKLCCQHYEAETPWQLEELKDKLRKQYAINIRHPEFHQCHESLLGISELLGVSWKEEE